MKYKRFGLLLVLSMLAPIITLAQSTTPSKPTIEKLINFNLIHNFEETIILTKQTSIERSLAIDNANEANIFFASKSKTLKIELISPIGQRFFSDNKSSAGVGSIIIASPERDNTNGVYIFILFKPQPGMWKYIIHETASTNELNTLQVSLLSDSPVRVSLQSEKQENRLNADVKLVLAVLEGRNTIKQPIIKATITRFNKQKIVNFHDDGTNGDARAGDGVFTASIKATEPGKFQFSVNIEGKNSQGNFFWRTASTNFNVIRDTARLLGSFSDRALDTNGDGLFDKIGVSPAIQVLEAGEYFIRVTLTASNGESIFSNLRVHLPTGKVNPEVIFDSQDIKEYLKVNGSYQVIEVFIERDSYSPNDRLVNLGNTKNYRIEQLQRDAIVLKSNNVKAVGIDINNNGKFDFLDVTVPVNFLYKGDYKWSASLATKNRTVIDIASSSGSFDVGNANLKLRFNGSKIGNAKLELPYIIQGFIVYGGGKSLRTDDDLSIPQFTNNRFEGFITDREPPKVNFSVEPTILKPANHQMVEIKVNAQVTDNIDPTPHHNIVKIATNDGYIVRGDLLTSDDIEIKPDKRVFLRAKPSKNGQERIYTITYGAKDSAGNLTQTTAEVRVPPE